MFFTKISTYISKQTVNTILFLKYRFRYILLYLSIVLFGLSQILRENSYADLLFLFSCLSIGLWFILKKVIPYSEMIILYDNLNFTKSMELLEKKKKYIEKSKKKAFNTSTMIYRSEYFFFTGNFEKSMLELGGITFDRVSFSENNEADKYFFLKFILNLYLDNYKESLKVIDDYAKFTDNNILNSFQINVSDCQAIYNLFVSNQANSLFEEKKLGIEPYNVFFNLYLASISNKINGNIDEAKRLTRELKNKNKKLFFVVNLID